LAAEEREIERLVLEKRLRDAKQWKRELLDEMDIDRRPREPPAEAQTGANCASAPIPDIKQLLAEPSSRPRPSADEVIHAMNRKTSKQDIVKRANIPLLREQDSPARYGEEQ
jgi:hypothetical protein